jgi:hypothetical protein
VAQTSWPEPHTDPELDRVVSDVQFEQLSQLYSGNGLYGQPGDPALAYGDSTGRHVKLRPNRLALVQGHPWSTDGDGLVVPIAAAPAARVDLVVLRLNRATWKVTAEVRQGVAGGAAPAPLQQADVTGAGTGVWELPIARVSIAANATTITAANVVPVAWYLSPVPLSATEATMPPAKPGQLVTQTDTGRLLMAQGAGWHIVGENGPFTKLANSGGWDSAKSNIYARRRNGTVWFQSLTYKISPSGDLAANTDVNVCVLPEEFRPIASFYTGGFKGESLARFYVNAATGAVTMVSFPTLKAGEFAIVSPVRWDANTL